MNKVFAYIDSHIIWVIIVALAFWFAGWFLSSFPPIGILLLVIFGIYFIREFKREIKLDIQTQHVGFIHKRFVKFVLFLFLFFILAGIAKITTLFTLWIIVWLSKGAEMADEIVMYNQKLVYSQTDFFVALPVMIILIVLYLRYLKQKRLVERLNTSKT